jgi:hypothetical protein
VEAVACRRGGEATGSRRGSHEEAGRGVCKEKGGRREGGCDEVEEHAKEAERSTAAAETNLSTTPAPLPLLRGQFRDFSKDQLWQIFLLLDHLDLPHDGRHLALSGSKAQAGSRSRFEVKVKRRLWRRESVSYSRKATRPKSSSMKEWAVVRASDEAVKKKRAKCSYNHQKKPKLAMRGVKHVRASSDLEPLQAMQWTRHLTASASTTA